MTAQTGVKNTIKKVVGNRLYAIMFQPGWPRWVLLAASVLVFLLVVCALSGGKDYREDPSALVPRSSQVYVETQDLDALLKNVAAWNLWKPDRRAKGDEQRNQLQVDLAGLIGDQVAGLGTRLPLLWLVGAKQAAYCVNKDDQGVESWALLLRIADTSDIISDIGVEPGMNVELVKGAKDRGVFKLTGTGAGELYFGVLAPWLIVSSQSTLPEFALESSRRPAFSLSRADMLGDWRRGVVVRGLVNPVYRAEQSRASAQDIIGGWLNPDVRVNFTSKIGRRGLETTFDANQLSERARGGGLWPLFTVLLAILGLIALALAVATALVMIGWGGWLKARAVRAGIAPAGGPAAVTPSAAFREDSGVRGGGGGDGSAPVPVQVVRDEEPLPELPAPEDSSKNGTMTANGPENENDATSS